MMLIGGWYSLAADVILTRNSNSETGVDGERLQIKDVVDVNQLIWSYTCPIRQWNRTTSVSLSCLGALFYALVRRNTRWRRKKGTRDCAYMEMEALQRSATRDSALLNKVA